MGPKHGKPLTEGEFSGENDHLDFNNIDIPLRGRNGNSIPKEF